MRALPANYKTQNDALAKQPVYVARVQWNNGNSGADGVNDIYFATCDVSNITGFAYSARWFPFLKADSIGSMSQTVDPINGMSSIGSLDITLTDFQGKVSDIIKAADAAGHGLRRQRISIIKLFKGMDWADRSVVRTMQVNDLKLTALNEYKLTSADVQRQMQHTVFNPWSTTLSAAIAGTGAITASVVDARNFLAVASVAYGAVGFIKIDDEIMRWTAKTDASFTIGAADRGMFGTVAATHANGANVGEIIVLNENPLTMALKIMQSSGVASTNGAWDLYPARWGCGMDSINDINEAAILEIGKLLAGLSGTPLASEGIQFEFVLDKGIEAKKFIEDSIFKILGCFGFVGGDGRYSIKAYSDLANAAKENAALTLDQNNVVKWGDLTYNYNELANQIWIEYDEQPKLSGKYIRQTLFIDSVSVKKWGSAKQLKYQAAGIIPTSSFASQLYQRFQRIGARYSRPPMQIPLTLLPKCDQVEIGDIVRVMLPVRDLFTGAPLDRAFEVISTQLVPSTGEIDVKCIAQPEHASFWFQGVGSVESITISPSTSNIPTGSTLQMVARTFDAGGVQVPTPAISWLATGNLTVSNTGLVTAGAVGQGTMYAVSGSKISNICTITITAAANSNAVASVSVVPSTVTFSAGDIQQLTAIAYDITGAVVNGVTFNWASSNPAAATIPAGADTSKLLTAVANGISNITATETVSAIASPATLVTVATPQTPTYTPPALVDSAYQIGTQITTHGPVGGPHVIPDGYNFVSGDYWYDGSVSLATTTTCTINGTVRIFSLGVITISGYVDGKGRGQTGAAAAQLGSWPPPNYQLTNGNSKVTFTATFPPHVIPDGFYGHGGYGAPVGTNSASAVGGYGAFPIYEAPPVISPSPITLSGTSWASVNGLPTVLLGSPGGSGAVCNFISRNPSGAGGASGAGLLLMARGIYISTGHVDLRGNDGQNASYYPGSGDAIGGGGGGGGGTFVALIERNANGLPVYSIPPANILVDGGIAGTSSNDTSVASSIYNGLWVGNATAGGYGTKITQVIG